LHFAKISREELLRENTACWNAYYSTREILRRTRSGVGKSWPLAGKISYFMLCLVFKRVYAGHGVAADSVHRGKSGVVTKALIKVGVTLYSAFFQKKRVALRVRA